MNPNAVPSQGGPKTPPSCYRCGLKGHIITKCRVSQDVVCHRCKKRGHLQRPCKSRKKPDQQKTKHQTKTVDQDDKEEEGDVEIILRHVKTYFGVGQLPGEYGGGHWCLSYLDV